jgi:signal transduction histidine kinase
VWDTAAALLDARGGCTIEHACRALDRLRRHLDASNALIWVVAGTHARCALHVRDESQLNGEAVVDAAAITAAIARLRRRPTIVWRHGESSHVEALIPSDVRSAIVTDATSHGWIVGVLVLGWRSTTIPCDPRGLPPLRIAAGLLARAVVVPDIVGAAGKRTNGAHGSFIHMRGDPAATEHAQPVFGDIGAKLVAAQEAERSRIARELHDDVGQQVALLASKLETLTQSPRVPRARTQAALIEALATLQELALSIHNLSHHLHPAKLQLLGLERTLDALCRDVAAECGIAVSFERGEIPADIREDTALGIFRVTQEALQNALRHSNARQIDVRLTASAERLSLSVADDGDGFDPRAAPFEGLGLLTMRERIELLGGRLRIETAPGRGTTIEAVVPMTRQSHRGPP